MSLSGTDLINNYELYFDGADMNNASLYLCVNSEIAEAEVQTIISAMRDGNLWSADQAKTVPLEHKPMYAEQMQFIGSTSGKINDKPFYIAAYNHEKFPCQPARWQAWQEFIAAHFDA